MVGAARMPTGPGVLSHVLEHEVVWLQHEEAMGLTANLTCHPVASAGFGDLQLRHLVLRTQIHFLKPPNKGAVLPENLLWL